MHSPSTSLPGRPTGPFRSWDLGQGQILELDGPDGQRKPLRSLTRPGTASAWQAAARQHHEDVRARNGLVGSRLTGTVKQRRVSAIVDISHKAVANALTRSQFSIASFPS
jgi:hypothetical protein